MTVNELVLKLLHIPNQLQEVTAEMLEEIGVEIQDEDDLK